MSQSMTSIIGGLVKKAKKRNDEADKKALAIAESVVQDADVIAEITENTTVFEPRVWKNKRVYIPKVKNRLGVDIYLDIEALTMRIAATGARAHGWKVEKLESGIRVESETSHDYFIVSLK